MQLLIAVVLGPALLYAMWATGVLAWPGAVWWAPVALTLLVNTAMLLPEALYRLAERRVWVAAVETLTR